MDTQEYVAGFVFDADDLNHVLLTQTQDKLAAIGGKVGVGEAPSVVMSREFTAKTGDCVEQWYNFCIVDGWTKWHENRWTVHYFYATHSLGKILESSGASLVERSVHLLNPAFHQFAEFVKTQLFAPEMYWTLPMAHSMVNGYTNVRQYLTTQMSRDDW